ncbi:short chain dehydrogenase, partial [Phakopsora pachyrhizi]
GGNSGIGYFICLELARKGAKVYLLCRNEGRTREAIESIKSSLISTSNLSSSEIDLNFIQFDLTKLKSCKLAAETFSQKEERLDILINNATVKSTTPYTITEDGIEIQACTSVGHFCLTTNLLPILKRTAQDQEQKQLGEKKITEKCIKDDHTADQVFKEDILYKRKNHVRIVNITSVAHKFNSEPDFENLNGLNQKRCSGLGRYGNSMLSVLLFTKELQKRLFDSGILCFAVHPGIIADRLFQDNKKLKAIIMALFLRTKESILTETREAAVTPLFAATSLEIELENLGGSYLIPPGKPSKPHPNARDQTGEMGKQLWNLCEDLLHNPDRLQRRGLFKQIKKTNVNNSSKVPKVGNPLTSRRRRSKRVSGGCIAGNSNRMSFNK